MYNMNNRNRRYYSNNRNIYHYNNKSNVAPMINQEQMCTNSDIPPIKEDILKNDTLPPIDIPPQNNSFNSNNVLNNLFGMFNSKSMSLDKDKLILLGLMYLLYKEDTSKENFKLLIALGYILI